MPRTRNYWAPPKSRKNVASFFFNAGLKCRFNPKLARFKYGGDKRVFCHGRNLTSVRPFVTTWTLLKNPNFGVCTWVNILSGHYPRFMTIGKDRNKDRFENWQLWSVWKLPFCAHRAIKLTQNCVSLTNPCINPLGLCLPSHVNTTPRYLNVSTCCNVLPHTLSWVCRET